MEAKTMRYLLLLFAMFSFSTAFAGDLHGIVSLGGDFGGDTLLTITYTDGSQSSLKAGQGLLFSAGVVYDFSPRFSLQSTIGIKYQQTQDATNENTSFTRYPLELLGFYNLNVPSFRFGAG